MKKVILVAVLAVLCVSCRTRPAYRHQKIAAEMRSAPVAEQVETPTEITSVKAQTATAYKGELDADWYRRNIVAKAMGDDYVIYEYSDVKIEDVATLAYHYCHNTNPDKKAYLRDIYMTKNHKRRATFDCVNLATD